MTWQLQLYFPDPAPAPPSPVPNGYIVPAPTYTKASALTAGYYFDASSLLTNKYKLEQGVFNESFQSVQNILSVTLANSDPVLYQAILNNNSVVKCVFSENGSQIFAGILRPQFQINVNNVFNTMDIQFVDMSYTLDLMTRFPIVLQNLKLHDPTNNANSAIYQILNTVLPVYGYTVPSISATDTGIVIPTICAPANTKLSDFLQELFFDYGFQYSIINGVFTITNWNASTATTVGTISNVAADAFNIQRKQVTEDSVEVDVQYLDVVNNVSPLYDSDLVSDLYLNATTEVSTGPLGMTVPATSDAPTGLSFTPTMCAIWLKHSDWAWTLFGGNQQVVGYTRFWFPTPLQNGVEVLIQSYNGDTLYGTVTWGSTIDPQDPSQYANIEVGVRRVGSYYEALHHVFVGGNILSQGTPRPVRTDTPGQKLLYKKYSAKYISGSGTINGSSFAKNLANALQANLQNNPLIYTFQSEQLYTLGANYAVSVPTISNAQVPSVNVKIYDVTTEASALSNGSLYKLYTYKALALSESTIDTTLTYTPRALPSTQSQITVPDPLTGNPVPANSPLSGSITQTSLEQVTTVLTKSGFYVTPVKSGYWDSVSNAFTNYIGSDGSFQAGIPGIASLYFDPVAKTLSITGSTVKTNNYVAGTTGWSINYDGTAEFNNVTVRGTVVSSAGTIGGFTIGATALTATNLGLDTVNGIYLGGASPSVSPFSVTVAGAVTATSGTIGGLTLSSSSLSAGTSGTSNYISVGTSGITLGTTFSVNSAGVLTASSGVIGGWTIGSTIQSNTGASYLLLDPAQSRVSVVGSSGTVAAMGYLSGLAINGSTWSSLTAYSVGDYVFYSGVTYKCTTASPAGTIPTNTSYWTVSTDTWTASDYGFWAKAGQYLKIDGPVSYSNGDWIIGHDASYLINQGTTTVVRLGMRSGSNGLYINEGNIGSSGYSAYLTSDSFFVGDNLNYISYGAGVLTLSLTALLVQSTLTSALGSLKISSQGTVNSLTNPMTLTTDSSGNGIVNGTNGLDLQIGGVTYASLTKPGSGRSNFGVGTGSSFPSIHLDFGLNWNEVQWFVSDGASTNMWHLSQNIIGGALTNDLHLTSTNASGTNLEVMTFLQGGSVSMNGALTSGSFGVGITPNASLVSILANQADGSGSMASGLMFQHDTGWAKAGIFADSAAGYKGLLCFATNPGANSTALTTGMTLDNDGNISVVGQVSAAIASISGALSASSASLTGSLTALTASSYSLTIGNTTNSWGGSTSYPTLYSSMPDATVAYINPVIPYIATALNSGSMTGSGIRFAGQAAATSYWDVGIDKNGITGETFSIGRNGSYPYIAFGYGISYPSLCYGTVYVNSLSAATVSATNAAYVQGSNPRLILTSTNAGGIPSGLYNVTANSNVSNGVNIITGIGLVLVSSQSSNKVDLIMVYQGGIQVLFNITGFTYSSYTSGSSYGITIGGSWSNQTINTITLSSRST